MPIRMTVKIDPHVWKSTKDFPGRYRRRFKLAMNEALAVLHGQVVLNLSGPSHTRFPGNGNPFPGTLTGRMKQSVHARQRQGGNRFFGVVGPNVVYARKQNEMRPFMAPALRKQLNAIQNIFSQAADDLAGGR